MGSLVSGQDGLTGTGFIFSPARTKKNANYMNQKFSKTLDISQQKALIPDRQETNEANNPSALIHSFERTSRSWHKERK